MPSTLSERDFAEPGPKQPGMSELPSSTHGDGKPSRRSFGLHTRRTDGSTAEAMQHARQTLTAAGADVLDLQQILDGEPADALLSFGGDGSLLHAARLMAPLGIPVLGINYGRVGYLCAVDENGLDQALTRLVHGECALDQRSMLRGRVFHEGELVWQADALNEFFVGGSNRTLHLDLSIDGEAFGTVRGDGVILATRTGSTAYAFSAGGPVLLMDALALVASNSVFSSAIRSVVLPTTSTVRIRNLTRGTRPFVVADGQKDYQIGHETEVEISLSPTRALLVDLGLQSHVRSLHQGFREMMVRELEG